MKYYCILGYAEHHSKSNLGYWPKNFILHRLLKEQNTIKFTLEQVLPKSIYYKFLKFSKKWNQSSILPIPTLVEDNLKHLFLQDILNFQELLGIELPCLKDGISIIDNG
ncbi:MAG: hypothetical protein F6K40_36755 [Okeania sp. SIO3I5]|uniref:hypothetical protein n=1 Tax=Okeania sp. SIO3I5 TaxID=2607805 RepID=UPI0013BC6B2F|nr:hypothetical protein [Okeania sp. SIO3I5]NEQ41448.1 hypothetical protein [Okeania sp. SIO3I5]